jgi:DNA-binding transcriptional LysR family regulator
LKTNQLRQFCTVYETKNLRKAAELLNTTHSALSKSLKTLQDEIGVCLLRPEGRGIEVTDDAIRLYPKMKELLAQQESLLSKPLQQAPHRIATFEVFSTHLMSFLWEKYFKKEDLDLFDLFPGKIEKAIIEFNADVGVTFDPFPTDGLEFIKIGHSQMRIFTKKGAFPKTQSEELPFVAPVILIEGTLSGIRRLDSWPEDRVPRRVPYQVDKLESGLALTRAGSAAIFIPTFVARLHNTFVKPEFTLIERRLPKKMSPVFRDIYIIKRKSMPENSLFRNLAKLLRNECAED